MRGINNQFVKIFKKLKPFLLDSAFLLYICTMKVIIAGGRDFNNYNTLKSFCDKVLQNVDKKDIEICCGMAKGADLLGKRYAEERGYKVKEFPANWDLHKKAAGYIRNKEMAEYADALIAFWSGISKGTKHMIDLAEKENLKIRIYRYGISN